MEDTVQKLIILIIGILIKSLYDWIFARSDEIKKLASNIAIYRENPAIIKGSKEAHRAICEHNYRISVQPEIKKLMRKAKIWKWIAPSFCIFLIVLLLIILLVFKN